MSEFIASARAWLSAISPDLPPAALIIVVFLTIYGVRRWLPRAWRRFENIVPIVDTVDPSPGLKTLLKFWQALPAALLAAGSAALLGGTSMKIALWGVVTATLTALSHEILADYAKFFGQVGGPAAPAVTKKSPSVPPIVSACFFLVAIALTLTLASCSASQSKAEAQNAAIAAGCEVSEALVLDGGEAGAAAEAADLASIKSGCTTALRVWDHGK